MSEKLIDLSKTISNTKLTLNEQQEIFELQGSLTNTWKNIVSALNGIESSKTIDVFIALLKSKNELIRQLLNIIDIDQIDNFSTSLTDIINSVNQKETNINGTTINSNGTVFSSTSFPSNFTTNFPNSTFNINGTTINSNGTVFSTTPFPSNFTTNFPNSTFNINGTTINSNGTVFSTTSFPSNFTTQSMHRNSSKFF